MHDASYEVDGESKVLVWIDRESRAIPVNGTAISKDDTQKVTLVDLRSIAASGDVSYYRGYFYPNKAPGTSFLAVPAYWFIYHIERMAGANPDNWWTLTLNAWLSCVFSVGILSALGAVLFYRLALDFSDGKSALSLLATLTFGFGTMFFPYATSLYEHNIIAVCLLAAFYLLRRAKIRPEPGNTGIFVSGLCAGYAAITNYIVAIPVILLALYLVFGVRRKNGWLWFGLGVLGPFLLICAYNMACFDTPFTTNYRYQNPYFRSTSSAAFLDVFVWPRWNVLVAILFSPFRGLFFTSPVLIGAAAGLVVLVRNKKFRAESFLAIAIVTFFVLFNTCFEAWDGGWAVAPRYLGPAVPFLALGLVMSFIRYFKTSCLLGAVSIFLMLLITAVDPQAPVGISDAARVLDKPLWRYNPISEYELPIFFRKQAWPLIHEQENQVLRYYETHLAQTELNEAAREAELQRFQDHLERLIGAAEPAPLVLKRDGKGADAVYSIQMSDVPAMVGPVSVNPGGIYGGGVLGPSELQWNSFNTGEFLFPASRWSLSPLLVLTGVLGWFAFRCAQERDRSTSVAALSGG